MIQKITFLNDIVYAVYVIHSFGISCEAHQKQQIMRVEFITSVVNILIALQSTVDAAILG